MARPQILLKLADAPETTGVSANRPSIHPNSIVVDAQPVHKLEPFLLSTVYQPDMTVRRRVRGLCYDENVRKQVTWRHGVAFLRHVVPAVVKPIHALWNQMIGFLFLSFGAIFALRTARYMMSHDIMRSAVAGAATAIMAWYGIGSFLRARKISRS